MKDVDPLLTPIVTACDQAYLPGLRALLRSLFEHCPRRRVCVIDCGISELDKSQLAHAYRSIEFRSAPNSSSLPAPSVGSRATYARLWIGALFELHARMIYLDSDVVVLQGLEELDSLVLQCGMAVAACVEPYTPTFDSLNGVADHARLGIEAATPYFNAGVMVVDVQRWNRLGIMGAAIEYLERPDVRISLFDQEALNVALRGRWQPLVPEWNVSRYWLHEARRVSRPDILERAKIVHFLSGEKPWTDPTKVDPRLLQHYLRYAEC